MQLDQLMPLIRESLAEGKSVKFSPSGVSMLPMLRPGKDMVTLSPITKPLKKYDIPLYQRDTGQYVLHRIMSVGETYTCIGDNQNVYEHDIREEQMIAVVTSFTRNGKEISVTAFSYRFYCHIWRWLRPVKKFLGRVKRFIRKFLA